MKEWPNNCRVNSNEDESQKEMRKMIKDLLDAIGRLDALKCPIQIRNYATDDDVK